jgi:hypothetical protein
MNKLFLLPVLAALTLCACGFQGLSPTAVPQPTVVPQRTAAPQQTAVSQPVVKAPAAAGRRS